MGLAETHNNRRGKTLRNAHGIFSAPCEAFYYAGTGEALILTSIGRNFSVSHFSFTVTVQGLASERECFAGRGTGVMVPAEAHFRAGFNLWGRSG